MEYTLRMPDPHTHLFRVEVRVPAVVGPLDLVMPSWTPGSYLLREFARHVQDFRAATPEGIALSWHKIDKSTWRIDPAGATEVVAEYAVYANELSVRTSHLDASHGYVNGASVFMFARGREQEPHEVRVEAPGAWRVDTAMEEVAPLRFRARDYDELVDSPMEIGTHRVLEWEQDGIPHRYAIWGRGNLDPERLVQDTQRIIDAARELFGDPLPYPRYLFILHLLPEGRGGLEHAASCSLQASRTAGRGEEYEQLQALVAHEFFHVWNAKRIRPEPLGPFDYTRENYTRNLWVVEGLTTYYTDRILLRAGLLTPDRYLTRLGDSIARLQGLPGRHHQSLEESSFDTWIRFYRPDEHTPNSQISYYQKGALVGMLLDLEIRRATDHRRSLDDVMRLLWERYGARDQGFPEDMRAGIQALAEEVAGEELGWFFDAYIRRTDELDYNRFLQVVGLRLHAEPSEPVRGPGLAGAAAAPTRPTEAVAHETRLGIRTRDQSGRARVTTVLEGTPAHRAGVNAGDEVVAVDGLQVSHAQLGARVSDREAGERVRLSLLRRDELVELEVEVGPTPAPKQRLARVEEPTTAQEAGLRGWVGLSTAGGDRTPEDSGQGQPGS